MTHHEQDTDDPPGPSGPSRRMRPVWAALGVGAALVLTGAAAHRIGAALDAPPGTLAAFAARDVAAAGMALAVVLAARRVLPRRSWSSLGASRPAGRPLMLGAVLWLLPAAAILAVALVAGWAEIGRVVPPGEPAVVAAVLPLAVLASLAGELVFRGYVQRGATAAFGAWAGVFGQAALFAVWSALLVGSATALAGSFLLGVLLGVLRNFTGGVWTGAGLGAAMTATGVLLAAAEFEPAAGAPGALWGLYSVAPFLTVLIAAMTRPRAFMGRTSPADLAGRPGAASAPGGLKHRGMLYDVGSSYLPGQHSRSRWNLDAVRVEMRVIREDLHCNAVTVFGRDPERLEQCAAIALEHGLSVWIQPRTVDAPRREKLEHLAEVARLAEGLRSRHPGEVGLSVGCEESVFTAGCIPGRDSGQRSAVMRLLPLLPLYNLLLRRLLRAAVRAARQEFAGPLTYGAGTWESVDWRPFDAIGLNYYWDLSTHANYVDHLRTFYRHDKPVIITEFGCCSFDGAELRGGAGAEIMDWSDVENRTVRPGHTRNEQVQADYIGNLIEVFAAEGLHGAFVCMFIEGDCTFSPDPRRDLDMASFGIVKPYPPQDGRPADEGHWEPKAAFHEIARRYGALEDTAAT